MASNQAATADTGISELVKDALGQGQKLLQQQFDLLRQELKEEVGKAGAAATSVGGGAGMIALGCGLGILAAVHFLHARTRLPLWACYGIVGGAFIGCGAQLLTAGVVAASDVHLIPEQTTEALKENAAAVGEALSEAVRS